MINFKKQEFLKEVDQFTDEDESVLGDLLNIVTNKFNRMVEREKNRRDSAHFKASRDLLDLVWEESAYKVKNTKLFDTMKCCCLLDAVSEVYPTVKGGCPAGEELLEHFARSARNLGWKPDDYFIKDVRGKSEWLKKLYEKY